MTRLWRLISEIANDVRGGGLRAGAPALTKGGTILGPPGVYLKSEADPLYPETLTSAANFYFFFLFF